MKTVCILFGIFLPMANSEETYMRAVTFEEPGEANVLQTSKLKIPNFTETQILIRVAYSAVNRADILQRKGKYNPPPDASPLLGLEVSGIVYKIGSQVTKWVVGDKVIALAHGGGYAQYIAIEEGHVMSLPSGLTLAQGAAIPEAWLTGYQILHMIGNARKGDWVLIHAAGSGVGTALVQMCALGEINAFVTAGSEEKIQRCLDLGAKGGANRKEENFDFATSLKELNSKGANLILDPVGASYWRMNADAASLEAKWLIYGFLGGAILIEDSSIAHILRKRLQLEGTTLRARSVEYKTELVRQFSDNILPHFSGSNAKVKTIVDSEFTFDQIAEAHTYVEENKNIGKVILKWSEISKDEL